MNGDAWRITSEGYMSASVQGLRPKFSTDKNDREYIDGFDYHSPGVAGYGSAIDFGATFKVLDNFTVSGAVIDFGFITWSKRSTVNGAAKTAGVKRVVSKARRAMVMVISLFFRKVSIVRISSFARIPETGDA